MPPDCCAGMQVVTLINISMAWRLPFGAHLAVQTTSLALLMCFAVHTYCTSLVRRGGNDIWIFQESCWPCTGVFAPHCRSRCVSFMHAKHALALATPCTPLPCSCCAAQPSRAAHLCCTKSWRCWCSLSCRRDRFCAPAVSASVCLAFKKWQEAGMLKQLRMCALSMCCR